MTRTAKLFLTLPLLFSLTACASFQERMSEVGQPPKFAAIENPVERAGYQPVSMPMPQKDLELRQVNSLWTSGRKSFFKDQRAGQIGDILTVMINIADQARLKNKTERKRDASDDMDVPGLVGLESTVIDLLPNKTNLNNVLSTASATETKGDGKIERDERIDLKVAAVITQILPNGNMVINGKQEVRVNNEMRQLTIDGVIRPEDIAVNNSISYEKIAEARIAYGGRGIISDVQKPRYGQEVMDIIMPF
ncbi:MAG TPA: flagellar basal body L-ring protein FlgH [Alphaproteobacteria bacterium]